MRPQQYVIFNGLNLKKSNLRNLLQLYAHNSITKHSNCTKIHTDNFEYSFLSNHEAISWYLVYFLNNSQLFFDWLWPLPLQPLNFKKRLHGLMWNLSKYYLMKFHGHSSKHTELLRVKLQHHFALKSMGDSHAFVHCWYRLNGSQLAKMKKSIPDMSLP